ncbi:unnamed protein product, partial [Aphanomyces euteiches]
LGSVSLPRSSLALCITSRCCASRLKQSLLVWTSRSMADTRTISAIPTRPMARVATSKRSRRPLPTLVSLLKS